MPIVKVQCTINHLFFTYDNLIFCHATLQEWGVLNYILGSYENASGQKFKRDKSSLFFNRITKQATKSFFMHVAGLHASSKIDKYLGLPSLIGRSRFHAFRMILDKFCQKLMNWKNKFSSQAGKEILIKLVLQSIPTYCMSVLLHPKYLRSQLYEKSANSWWGHLDNQSRMHWKNWDALCSSNVAGVMGFRHLNFL